MDTGGAPIHNDDLIMLQQNAKADFINANEMYRSLLSPLMFYDGIGNPYVKKFENGLILSGLTYDNTNPSSVVINEGYFLSGGEVCYYAGGTFNTGGLPLMVFLKKGAANFTSRTFNDGFSKEITVSYDVVVETSLYGVGGIQMPIGTTIVPTDEVVVIEIGVNTNYWAENYFTKQAALGLTTLESKLKAGVFAQVTNLHPDATIGTGAATIYNFMGSRVTADGFTEIIGSVTVSGYGGSPITLFRLATNGTNITDTGGIIPFPVSVRVSGGFFETVTANYTSVSRDVEVIAPTVGATPNTFTTETKIYFNVRLCGAEPTTFDLPNNFLDVTP